MTRVAVIGNAGGGKSTMCARLSAITGLPYYPIDKIQWQPGWVPTPRDDFNRRHDALIERERWIIDGWGSPEAIAARFEAADTIIFVDHPLAWHYWWAIKRQVKSAFGPVAEAPEGCPLLPVTWRMLRLIWQIHWTRRPDLLRQVEAFRDRKRVVHIRSPRQLRRFVREVAAGA
jgi:adenylate kinase family enzyme